jgi:hypothetical protein
MQSVDGQFRNKVFDEEVLNFCLVLIEFIEKMPNHSAILRRVVLDALTVSSSLAEVSVFVKSLNTLPLEEFAPHMEAFLDSCAKLSQQDIKLEDFLMTVRHLAERQDFHEWKGYFAAIAVVGDRASLLTDFLMTMRHLVPLKTFHCWDEFYTSVRIFGDNDQYMTDLLMTVRHLADLKDFNEWESFLGALKILGEQKSNISEFLMAVRHAINYFHSSDSLKSIFKTMAMVPQYSEACAFGQLDSKQWLIQEARKVWGDDWGSVFVLAGWIGFLPRFIFDAGIKVKNVRSFDIDPDVGGAAESLNQSYVQKDWLFKSSTMDITQLTYPAHFSVKRKDGSLCELYEMPDVVINTSCEHLSDIGAWWSQIPMGTRVIVQSNDAFHIPEHVKCFKSLGEFEAAMNLSKIDYRGEKELADFNRFMLIGIK